MKSKQDYLNQHSKPVTRRDFISRGLYGACGYVVAPSVLGWLLGGDSKADPTKASPKFITFDLVGGAAMFGNFLVGGAGGPEDLLKSYSLLGWDPRAASALDRRFGLPMAANNVSQMLSGILQTASAAAQKNFRMGSLLHVAQIDTADNPLSILGLVSASGLASGGTISSPTGLKDTFSGGRSGPLFDIPANRPTFVKDVSTLVNSVGLSGNLTTLSDDKKVKAAKLLSRLSTSQAKAMLGGPLSQAGFEYLSGLFGPLPDHIQSGAFMDPRKNLDFQQIYGISEASAQNDPQVLRAALAMNTLAGNTGPSVITIEGCDYHDGTQTTGDAKDLEIGKEIGKVIEAAARLKTPLVIHIITDGGIYPLANTRKWTGDNVETCMTVMGVYQPNGVPAYYANNRMQIGAYTQNQGADRSTLIGSNTALVANAAFANYLSIAGRMDLLTSVFPKTLGASQLESTLLFGAIS